MKNTVFSIRHATYKDYEPVCMMVQALALEENSVSIFNSEHLHVFLKEQLNAVCLVAYDNNTIIGCLLAYVGYDVQSATRGWHLSDLYIMPDKRQYGAATLLMQALRKENSSCEWISWTVLRTNKIARKFYAALQAEEVDVCFMAMTV